MRKLKVTFKGTKPLFLHNNQCVNILHPISRKMKEITGKRKKTEEDLAKLSDLEFLAGLYWDDKMGVIIPSTLILATIKNGAKDIKKGAAVDKYLSVEELNVKLNYGEELTKEQLMANLDYRDTRVVKINGSSILKTRPRFEQWDIIFTLSYPEDKMSLDDIVQSIEYAGNYVGLGAFRKMYGRFVSNIEEIQ